MQANATKPALERVVRARTTHRSGRLPQLMLVLALATGVGCEQTSVAGLNRPTKSSWFVDEVAAKLDASGRLPESAPSLTGVAPKLSRSNAVLMAGAYVKTFGTGFARYWSEEAGTEID